MLCVGRHTDESLIGITLRTSQCNHFADAPRKVFFFSSASVGLSFA